MPADFQVTGKNPAALFTLKIHRGEGMALLAMNWKQGKPSRDFVGFAIEYMEPGGDRFFALKNRIAFPAPGGEVDSAKLSTRLSPIQKFRWIHFPRNANLPGKFRYRVTPVFMNALDELSYGEPQEAALELRGETLPGKLNVTFTRGFVSSQAFVDRYVSKGPVSDLLPKNADQGLDFAPTHPLAAEALRWMGAWLSRQGERHSQHGVGHDQYQSDGSHDQPAGNSLRRRFDPFSLDRYQPVISGYTKRSI